MRGLLPIIVAGCTATPSPATPTPLAEPAPAAETVWDRGTYITIDKDVVFADSEENFEIFRTPTGYRMTIQWKRPAPTGERGDGNVVLETDARFSPLNGKMESTLYVATGTEVTRSSIQRDPDGLLATQVIAADGSRTSAKAKERTDWYIGGAITTFLVAICQAGPDVTAPVVFPGKVTELAPATPLVIEGETRHVTLRILTYPTSGTRVVAACEDGKLVGEVTRGVTIVRRGDLALARALGSSQ